MASSIVRVSDQAKARVEERRRRNGRTFVAEMDVVIEAGLSALEKSESRPTKAPTAKKATAASTG